MISKFRFNSIINSRPAGCNSSAGAGAGDELAPVRHLSLSLQNPLQLYPPTR